MPNLGRSDFPKIAGDCSLATFFRNITISQRGLQEIQHTTRRAAIFIVEAKTMGVKVKEISWTLGDHNGRRILEALDGPPATAAILHLGVMGNVHTAPAPGLHRCGNGQDREQDA